MKAVVQYLLAVHEDCVNSVGLWHAYFQTGWLARALLAFSMRIGIE